MSRTLRRASARYNYWRVLRRFERVGWDFISVPIAPTSREGKKLLARYHSDAGFGDYWHATPPRWYRRQLNRTADRREAQALHRWLSNPDGDLVLAPRVRCADRYW